MTSILSQKPRVGVILLLLITSIILFIRKRKQWISYLIRNKQTKPRVLLHTNRLSPFGLKLEAIFKFMRINYVNTFDLEEYPLYFLALTSVELARSFLIPLENPPTPGLGELPLVPFVISTSGGVWYDSSHIGRSLVKNKGRLGQDLVITLPFHQLYPQSSLEPEKCNFLSDFLEEFFDEIGLYLVHFERWTNKKNHPGGDTTPGDYLCRSEIFNQKARPFLSLLAPEFIKKRVARGFNKRQTRRLPYLFAVGHGQQTAHRKDFPFPPSTITLPAFPETWTFLSKTFEQLLNAVEPIFKKRNSLFNTHRWTLADAALFGQLNMNARQDIGSREKIQELAPCTLKWLDSIEKASGEEVDYDALGTEKHQLDFQSLQDLMDLAIRVFPPIMKQNEQAYERIKHDPKAPKVFNEKAFDLGLSFYDGVVDGHPYRSVVKTFQVEIWRDLRKKWQEQLSESDRHDFELWFPGLSDSLTKEST
jgi:hypothetical protein